MRNGDKALSGLDAGTPLCGVIPSPGDNSEIRSEYILDLHILHTYLNIEGSCNIVVLGET